MSLRGVISETGSVIFFTLFSPYTAFENNIIIRDSEEITSIKNDTSDGLLGGNVSPSMLSIQIAAHKNKSSAEIYSKSKQKPHVLYQLFQLNSHSRPANIILNHNIHKLTTVKKKRPSIINLFPNHPNRTRIVTRKRIKKPRHELSVCCTFPSDVNDGQTYHCRNRMVDFTAKPFKNSSVTVKPIWNAPSYFMTNGQDTMFA